MKFLFDFLSLLFAIFVGCLFSLLGGYWEGDKVHINGVVVVMSFIIAGWMACSIRNSFRENWNQTIYMTEDQKRNG